MEEKETVQSLRICSHRTDVQACTECSLFDNEDCMGDMMAGAADLIERLTAENADLCKEIEWKDMMIALAQRKQAEAEAERDALREKVPQWVSVANRLPELWKNEKTGELINYMVRSPYFGVDIGNYQKEAGTWLCMGLPCTVTHWMPLPEAPGGGK
jgi:hypothetical protein